MAYKLTFWSIHRHPATAQRPAFAFVYIKGEERHLTKRLFKTESYNVPYDPNPAKNTNEALVRRAIALSQNKWDIPRGTNFK
jgi:hypothetical protein